MCFSKSFWYSKKKFHAPTGLIVEHSEGENVLRNFHSVARTWGITDRNPPHLKASRSYIHIILRDVTEESLSRYARLFRQNGNISVSLSGTSDTVPQFARYATISHFHPPLHSNPVLLSPCLQQKAAFVAHRVFHFPVRTCHRVVTCSIDAPHCGETRSHATARESRRLFLFLASRIFPIVEYPVLGSVLDSLCAEPLLTR
jgi:hypothetical protein